MSPRSETVAPAVRRSVHPNTLIARSPGLAVGTAHHVAVLATELARSLTPKSSGDAARSLAPYWGFGFWGMSWSADYLWVQETGSRAFTMRSLAGKTIPMWVNDLDGSETAKIAAKDRPQRTRTTEDGRRQVLIFRKAAQIGARKNIVRGGVTVNVPASYPGAPGRIARRQMGNGRIASGNVGVRWRHPGLAGRGFLHHSLMETARRTGLGVPQVQDFYREGV